MLDKYIVLNMLSSSGVLFVIKRVFRFMCVSSSFRFVFYRFSKRFQIQTRFSFHQSNDFE